MTITRNEAVTHLLNGTISSFKNVVPVVANINKPELLGKSLQITYGVLIGFTGDVRGKLILSGDTSIFGSIGETMFGMTLDGVMLTSFSGELGNMVAGGLSTNIAGKGINTDITAPTIMDGKTNLSGYEKALQVPISLDQLGDIYIYILLD
ncbi:chemotaxis protein CheX [Salirhabdus euzebyi]|uniref:Chemotaxis protein CheX n=1 Tax=Salirhabdus euzebyi TaxID=394506 RepID=A0A841Q5Q8_9BACI|nr:chemotaxis protein CheX [Salirhabdus euzebyi]MBB6453740.1 chemotaxis protein CheX [Salirhabdus euzebyi]